LSDGKCEFVHKVALPFDKGVVAPTEALWTWRCEQDPILGGLRKQAQVMAEPVVRTEQKPDTAPRAGEMDSTPPDTLATNPAGHQEKPTKKAPQSTTAVASTSPYSTVQVDHWSNLAIGFDGEWRIFAFVPCPDRGGYVSISNAIPLNLPGDRWRNPLELLAQSEDGRTARIQDLVMKLGYVK